MRKVFISLLLLLGVTLQVAAQMPKDIMKDPIPVAMFQATYAFQQVSSLVVKALRSPPTLSRQLKIW